MKKHFLLLYALLATPVAVQAGTLWQDLAADQDKRAQSAATDTFRPLLADHQQLKHLLWQAPLASDGQQGILIELPLPDGNFIDVEVFASPVLSAELASAFPDIKTFQAHSPDNPAISGRLDFTPNGFHAMLRTDDGIIYINPETAYSGTGDIARYRAFAKHTQTSTEPFICTSPEHRHGHSDFSIIADTAARPASARSFPGRLRTYRLALSATREYSLAVASGDLNNTYAEMVTAINRVNEIYQRDLAISLQLVSGTDLIAGSTTDFSDNDAEALLEQNQSWTDSKIGSNNYDIGHVFSTGGGGLALIGITCNNDGYKAQGVTGSSSPTTDAFYIDYVAHELGHQFGATHTFNARGNNSGSCDETNWQEHSYEYTSGLFTSYMAASAYEPGSGSTIMAYAGICAAQNLQDHSDAYFHARSIEQIREYVDGDIASTISWADGSLCGSNAAAIDIPPVADAGSNYTIPANTPFLLTGSASDSDSDTSTFTHTWEQLDLGQASSTLLAMHTDRGSGPLVRSRPGTRDGQRFVPTLEAILSGNLAANTGERLPTTNRTMKFRLTVRSGTTGIAQDDMTITVDKDAGPFRVSTPLSGNYNALQAVNINWAVANTSAAPVNCSQVDIWFSADGGYTFPTLLLDNTANDGNAEVILPNTATSLGRIKVACNDNIFFHISPANFAISASDYSLSFSGTLSGNEGNSGITAVPFTLTLNQAAPATITVNYSVTGSGGHPASADDFGGSFPAGSIVFVAGETVKTVSLPVSGDTFAEFDETFTLSLANSQGIPVSNSEISGILQNDDLASTLNITANAASHSEGDSASTTVVFLLERLGNSGSTTSVDYAIVGSGSHPAAADDFSDGVFPAGSVNFAAGETSKTISVSIAGDTVDEENESFTISLANVTGGIIHTGNATVTILDDDTAVRRANKKSGGGNTSALLCLLLLALMAVRYPRQQNPVSPAVNRPPKCADCIAAYTPAEPGATAGGCCRKPHHPCQGQ